MPLAKPDPDLRDGDLFLRPLGHQHVEAMTVLAQDADVARHTYVGSPFVTDDAIAWIGRYVEGWSDGSRAGFAIEDADGTFLGFCSLVTIDAPSSEAELGYITVPAARGRGVAPRMLRLITRWSFEVLELERLELRIDVENAASVTVAERAGFQHEGTLRNVYFKDGRRIDLMIYSRLRRDGGG